MSTLPKTFYKNIGTIQKTITHGSKSKLWQRSVLLHVLNESLKLHFENNAIHFSHTINEISKTIIVHILCSHSTQIAFYQMQIHHIQSLVEQDLKNKNCNYIVRINLKLK